MQITLEVLYIPHRSDALHGLYHNGLSPLYHDVPVQTKKQTIKISMKTTSIKP